MPIRNIVLIMLSILIQFSFKGNAQSCDPETPSYIVNLSGSSDSLWISPSESRKGVCCGYNPGPPDNYRCVEFWLTLDDDAQGIVFDVHSGAKPTGALGWSVNCGPLNPVGKEICLDGSGPHWITFCKPGNNPNSYSIRSVPKPSVTPPITVSNTCGATLSAFGYQENTIRWTSIPYDSVYNSYLSCTEECSTVTASYEEGAPPYVDYEVSGIPLSGCSNEPVRQRTRVYFINDKEAKIVPENPVICYGGADITITAIGSGGAPPYEYLWNTGEISQSIEVGVGTYTVEIKDSRSCPGATATVTVTAFESPIAANAGPDLLSCKNNPATEISGTIEQANGGVWSGGDGSFEPNIESLDIIYLPTEAEIRNGSITLTLTSTGNGGCPPSEDQMTITFTDPPIADAGPDQNLCSNNPQVQLNGKVTNAGGGIWSGGNGNFIPDASTLNAVYEPTEDEIFSGSLVLTLTTNDIGDCLPESDEMSITFTPAPEISADDITVCANNPEAELSATVLVASGVQWSGGNGTFSQANSLQTYYMPSPTEIENGKADLLVTTTGNGNCLPVNTSLTIYITPAPKINAGEDINVCSDINSVELNGSVTIAGGGIWSGGTGFFSNEASPTSEYFPSQEERASTEPINLTLTSAENGNCLPVTDNVSINMQPLPKADAGPDQTVCKNNPDVSLSGSVINASGGEWKGGAGVFSPGRNALNTTYIPTQAELDAGNISLKLTTTGNNLCPYNEDIVNIRITPAPEVNAGNDQTTCKKSPEIELHSSVTVTNSGSWSGGTGMFTNRNNLSTIYKPSSQELINGSVTLTLTSTNNGNCLPEADQITLNFLPQPEANAGPDQIVCNYEKEINLIGSVKEAGGGAWSTEGSGIFHTTSPNGTTTSYSLSEKDSDNDELWFYFTTTRTGICDPITDSLRVNLIPPPDLADIEQIVCNGTQTMIELPATSEYSYEWFQNNTSLGNISNILETTANEDEHTNQYFTVEVTDTNNCTSPISVTLQTYPPPEISLTNSPACEGDTLILNARPSNISRDDIAIYEWFKNDSLIGKQPELQVANEGTYHVRYHIGECYSEGSSTVRFHPNPKPGLDKHIKFCYETDHFVTLDAGAASAYQWETGSTEQTLIVNEPGIYNVTIFNEYDCPAKEQILVENVCKPRVFVPNAITPGGNGDKGIMAILGANFKSFKLTIFSRWGEIIFYSEDKNHVWDGYYKGEPMPIGTYPWILEYEGDSEEYKGPYKKQGSITVVR